MGVTVEALPDEIRNKAMLKMPYLVSLWSKWRRTSSGEEDQNHDYDEV